MKNDKIIEEANAYLNGNLSMKDTAISLNINIRTFQLHMKKLEEIDPELHKMVINKKNSNQRAGRKLGGQIGKRSSNYTKEEARKIAEMMLIEELTYEKAAEKFDIPKSTIYEMTHSKFIDKNTIAKLEVLATANKKAKPVDDYIEEQRKKW